MRRRLTRLADRDLETVLRASRRHFGATQGQAYAGLIRMTLDMAAEDPARPSSRPHQDWAPVVRSLHVAAAAGRRGAARHVIYDMTQIGSDEAEELVILRVLHDAMDPRARVAAALRDDLKRS